MAEKFPILCSPVKIGNVIYRNRMFSAPMGATDITADCCIGPRTVGFYELRAKGGAAAVTVSELVVHPETDGSHMLHLDLSTPGSLASFTYTADAIRRHGAVPSVELSHSGQYAGTYIADANKKKSLHQFGPSDTVRPDGIPVKALSIEQIKDIIAAYGERAALAKRAGFEMVMVHAGHGWLINQFLSPWFNHREDEYGGSFEKRLRFAREVLTEVRRNVGPQFPIELRLSGSELFEGGYTLEDGCEIAHALEDLVDLIHVSAGSYQFGFYNTHLPMFSPRGNNVYLAAEIKKHVSKPVAAIGGLSDPEMMERILEEGKADIIYMARQLLADPFLPEKVMGGQESRITKCLRCFTCMAERVSTQTRRCAVNPVIGRELEGMEVSPAAKSKKVIVAGAGPAGLKAAITAAQRGHSVILCEKTDSVGGILKSEQNVSFKRDMYELAKSLELQALDEGVEIRLNTPVTAEYVKEENADALIIAVGSNPIVPPIPGLDGENIVIVNDCYRSEDRIGESVVVLGGGLAGCECAIDLAQKGKKVRLVEMRDTLAPDCNVRNRPILMQKIGELVETYVNHTAVRAEKNGLVCRNESGEEVLIAGETIVCAAGQRSNREDAEKLHRCAKFVREVGDCVRPANITKAIYEGYHAALDI